jgi:hypothetical protein
LNVHPLKDECDGCGGVDKKRHQERWILCRGVCQMLNDGWVTMAILMCDSGTPPTEVPELPTVCALSVLELGRSLPCSGSLSSDLGYVR